MALFPAHPHPFLREHHAPNRITWKAKRCARSSRWRVSGKCKVLGAARHTDPHSGSDYFSVPRLSQRETTELLASTAVVLALFLIFQAAQEWLNYNQWQFIVTNKRFILITPHPQRRGFADVIYLKGGKIQVLDTNFSKNPLWGMFQMIQGTRDVMLSMSGYEFQETGAQVKGGLRFPDVKPEDIRRLEELIFG